MERKGGKRKLSKGSKYGIFLIALATLAISLSILAGCMSPGLPAKNKPISSLQDRSDRVKYSSQLRGLVTEGARLGEKGDFTGAIATLSQAHEIDPENKIVDLFLAKDYDEEGDLRHSFSQFQIAMSKEKTLLSNFATDPSVLCQYGEVAFRLGNVSIANEQYKLACSKKNLQNLAGTVLDTRTFSDANKRSIALLIWSRQELDHPLKRLELASRAASISPKWAFAKLELAKVKFLSGDVNGSKIDLIQSIRLGEGATLYAAARAYEQEGLDVETKVNISMGSRGSTLKRTRRGRTLTRMEVISDIIAQYKGISVGDASSLVAESVSNNYGDKDDRIQQVHFKGVPPKR